MIKFMIKLALMAAVALTISNCSKENPLSVKSAQVDDNSVAALLPTPTGPIANLGDTLSGYDWTIAVGSDNYVYYRALINKTGAWTPWAKLSSTGISSNIVTLYVPPSNKYSGNWVIFRGSDGSWQCWRNISGSGVWTFSNYVMTYPCPFPASTPKMTAVATKTGITIYGVFQGSICINYNFNSVLYFVGQVMAMSNNNFSVCVTNYSSDLVQIFGTSMDKLAWTIPINLANPPFAGLQYQALSGGAISTIDGDLVGALNTDGRLEVFGVNNQVLYHNWQSSAGSSSWSGWSALTSGGAALPSPIMVGNNAPSGRMEVFFQNPQGQVMHIYQSAASSGPWVGPVLLYGSDISLWEPCGPYLGLARSRQAPYRKFLVTTVYKSDVRFIEQLVEDGAWTIWGDLGSRL